MTQGQYVQLGPRLLLKGLRPTLAGDQDRFLGCRVPHQMHDPRRLGAVTHRTRISERSLRGGLFWPDEVSIRSRIISTAASSAPTYSDAVP